MNHTCRWTALAVMLAASLFGCESKVIVQPKQPEAKFAVPESRAECTALLVQHSAAFEDDVAQMPGDTGAEHRQLLAAALDELSKALKLANGPGESPEFINRLSVIDTAQKTAMVQSIPRGRMEAIENQSLYAASKALEEITRRDLFDDDQMPPLLEAASAKTGAAMHVNGPIHDVDATEAFRSIAAATARVTADMQARFGTGGVPGETPAAAPATAP